MRPAPEPDLRQAPFAGGREHLAAALECLQARLRRVVLERRREPAAARFHELSGLVITDDEIERLWPPGPNGGPEEAGDGELERLVQRLERRLAERVAASLSRGVRLPLVELARLFELTPLDVDALLVCLAPELDLRFEKLYAYLHDDVTRKRPSAGLVLEVACRRPGERLDARARLAAGAPLLRHLILIREPGALERPFLARALRVDDRIVGWLLGLDVPDEALEPFTRRQDARVRMAELALPGAFRDGLGRLFHRRRAAMEEGAPACFVFEGRPGLGKRAAAEALCAGEGRALLVASARRLLRADSSGAAGLAVRLLREARLSAAAVCLEGADALLAEGHGEIGRELVEVLAGSATPVFLLSEAPWPPALDGGRGALCRVPFPSPDYRLRRRLWRSQLAAQGLRLAPGADLDSIAERFAFGAEHIRRSVSEARHRAWFSNGEGAGLSTDDLRGACRAQASGRLDRLARKITPLYGWDDIVLEPDRLRQLREVCAHVRHHRTVFERWGFDRKIARGKGVTALFVGPSGGGKTLAAEIMAGELGLDLYKIDLSSVVSKYIGETEKNLARIFREAEESPVVLFFDEADALFGRRSQVKDAHDRYANIEINYLLQRMEDHEGVVILASNFRKNIDEAFTRRLRFVVELPMPAERERLRLWQRMFPSALPCKEDLDLEFLARKFKLTGGHIKNVVLAAAFMAAEHGGPVAMSHLVQATQRELQKTGRLCVKSDFEQYFDLVCDGEGVLA